MRVSSSSERGSSFGELSFFSNASNAFVARSRGFSKVLYINNEDFSSLLKQHSLHEDYERFAWIRDSVQQGNLAVVGKKCDICGYVDHSFIDCPCVHYAPVKIITIHRYNYSPAVLERVSSTRLPKKRTKTDEFNTC